LGDPDIRGWAAGSLLFAVFVLEQPSGVGALSQTMLEAWRSTGSQSMIAIAMHYTCLNWLGQGKVDEVIEMGEAGVAICREAGRFLRAGKPCRGQAAPARAAGSGSAGPGGNRLQARTR
jgi:hypothetical protein